ncbi:MAG: cytochrome-c peroxidase [Chitinophagaceae bacterium]|nr:cytochrome-c peroxidase [Chitinophagaceae bacterium]
MRKKYFIILTVLAFSVYACTKSVEKQFLSFQQPGNFPEPVYRFATNLVTKEGFELGRKLFYDPILSRNNTISCGSCHIQTSAFTQHGHSVSHGIEDKLGVRNSPPIMNLAWNTSFMWDGGVFDLDLQPVAPITNHVEMDETVTNVISKLKAHPDYPGLFQSAFGTTEVSTARFMKALSQFMAMCVSSNSKYDSVIRKEGKTFTKQEEEGYALYKQKCSSCHTEPLFTDQSFRNNGIGIGLIDDAGRYAITLDETDRYKFKVPSLRNLDYTAPYMHDGRFLTLDAVLDHYSSGVKQTQNLDMILQNNEPGIPMTADEKTKVKAFLKTLNDKVFIANKLLSEQ